MIFFSFIGLKQNVKCGKVALTWPLYVVFLPINLAFVNATFQDISTTIIFNFCHHLCLKPDCRKLCKNGYFRFLLLLRKGLWAQLFFIFSIVFLGQIRDFSFSYKPCFSTFASALHRYHITTFQLCSSAHVGVALGWSFQHSLCSW